MNDIPGTDLSTFYELTQNFSTILHTRKPQQKDFFYLSLVKFGTGLWTSYLGFDFYLFISDFGFINKVLFFELQSYTGYASL